MLVMNWGSSPHFIQRGAVGFGRSCFSMWSLQSNEPQRWTAAQGVFLMVRYVYLSLPGKGYIQTGPSAFRQCNRHGTAQLLGERINDLHAKALLGGEIEIRG